jgi:hypothetical protein
MRFVLTEAGEIGDNESVDGLAHYQATEVRWALRRGAPDIPPAQCSSGGSANARQFALSGS